jgi:hypothetical protein
MVKPAWRNVPRYDLKMSTPRSTTIFLFRKCLEDTLFEKIWHG